MQPDLLFARTVQVRPCSVRAAQSERVYSHAGTVTVGISSFTVSIICGAERTGSRSQQECGRFLVDAISIYT